MIGIDKWVWYRAFMYSCNQDSGVANHIRSNYGGPKGRAMHQYLSDNIYVMVDDNYVMIDDKYVTMMM